jgi:hypothetical protein
MKRADFQPPVDGARRPWRSGSEEAGPESDAMAGWRLRLACLRSARERTELLSVSVEAWVRLDSGVWTGVWPWPVVSFEIEGLTD